MSTLKDFGETDIEIMLLLYGQCYHRDIETTLRDSRAGDDQPKSECGQNIQEIFTDGETSDHL